MCSRDDRADASDGVGAEYRVQLSHMERSSDSTRSGGHMATSTLEALEQRVAALEQNMARLLQSPEPRPRFKDWRQAIGLFPGDELMKQIDDAGRAIREADRQNPPL